MATKKAAPKSARSASSKSAKTAKAARPAAKKAPAKSVKMAPKKAAPKKAGPSKAAPKKPARPTGPGKKVAATKIAVKSSKTAAKAAPKKSTVAAPKKAVAPAKKMPVAAPKKAAKPAEPTKKPVPVPAPTPTVHMPVRPPQAAVKKEPPKPTKIVIPKTSTTKAVKYEPDFTRSVLDKNQEEQKGPNMRYSDVELQEFRDLINRKLETAKKELAYLQGLITRKDESGDLDEGRYMTMEDGSMSMEREQLSQMASRQIQFIDHLEKAIMRIENKTYGVCRVTGKLIDKARLRAVPHATLSIEAKQLMNK